MLRGTQAYFQTSVSTVGQAEILIMLYEGAIRFLTRAKEKIEAKDLGAKGILISKALDIINELDCSINMEVGGSLAKNLHQLYFVCSTRLLKANMRLDIEALDSVIRVLTRLKDTYVEIMNRPEAKAASAQIAAKRAMINNLPQRTVPLPQRQAKPMGDRVQMQSAYEHAAAEFSASTNSATTPINSATTPAAHPANLSAPVAPVVTPEIQATAQPHPVPQPVHANAAQSAPTAPLPNTAPPVAKPAMPQQVQQPVASQTVASQPEAQVKQETPPVKPAPVNPAGRRLAALARYGKIGKLVQ